MHFHVWVGQYISITEGKMILAALAQFAEKDTEKALCPEGR